VDFQCGVYIGRDVPAQKLIKEFDAVALCGGCEAPRDLPIAGRDLDGVHFAMEYLPQQNRRVAGDDVAARQIIAMDKNVVVIGGGDTGSDCIGTAKRQGARAIVQLEVLPKPPEAEDKMLTWPDWPLKLRTSSSQEEGCEREFAVVTKAFRGEGGAVKKLSAARVEWKKSPDGKTAMTAIPDSEFEISADLVLLAMGYTHPVYEGMLQELACALDARGNVDAPAYKTSAAKLFAAGDMRRGQSLVVWAIREGRQCARAMDEFLMGESQLPQ
jgi:glutamate synthase (NADPH/NADH) small chain